MRERDEATRRAGRRRRDQDHPDSWIFGPRWKIHLDLFDSRTGHRPPGWRTGVGLAALVAVVGAAAFAPASPIALTRSSAPPAVDSVAGLPAGTELTPTGKLVVTEDGAVVDGMDVRGAIWVQADGVRITNSRVVSGTYHTVRIFDGADGTVIEDSDVGCTDGALNGGKGVVFGNYTARRVEIVGCGTPFVTASGDVRVTDAVWNGRAVDDIAIGEPRPAPGGPTPSTTTPGPSTPSTTTPATTAPTTPPTTRPAPSTTVPPATTVPPTTPPAGGFPDAATTGPRPGVTLTPSGSLNVTQDGAVIQNLHVTGTVTINADDVTIRNTLIDNTGTYPIRITSGRNLVVEDSEIDGNGSASVAILPGSYTLRRVDIHDVRDGPRIEGNDVLIEDSYIHHLHRIAGGHHDAIQIRNGVGVLIRRNNLQAYHPATGDPMNAAIQIGSLNGPLRGLVVDGNLMNGGNYTINAGKSSPDPSYWRNNRFGRNFRYGVVTGGPGVVWESTNVYDDNGQPVR